MNNGMLQDTVQQLIVIPFILFQLKLTNDYGPKNARDAYQLRMNIQKRITTPYITCVFGN